MQAFLALAIAVAVTAPTAGDAARAPVHRWPVPGYRTSVELPASWKAVDYREILEPGVMQSLAQENPEFAGSFAAMAQASSPVKFFAYDPKTSNGFATNLNLIVVPVRRPLTFAEYRSSLVGEVRSLAAASGLRASTVRLPAGPAVHLSYRVTITVGGRTITALTSQYGFVRRSRSEVFTYTTLPATAPLYSSVFTSSARSIRIAG
jgi:hypothetical protein